MMKDISYILRCFFMTMIPISAFCLSAFLIYSASVGWGWFLFVVALFVLSFRMKIDRE